MVDVDAIGCRAVDVERHGSGGVVGVVEAGTVGVVFQNARECHCDVCNGRNVALADHEVGYKTFGLLRFARCVLDCGLEGFLVRGEGS